MGCSCKSNTSVRKQATRIVRRATNAPTTHSDSSSSQATKKTVVIRRPAR